MSQRIAKEWKGSDVAWKSGYNEIEWQTNEFVHWWIVIKWSGFGNNKTKKIEIIWLEYFKIQHRNMFVDMLHVRIIAQK